MGYCQIGLLIINAKPYINSVDGVDLKRIGIYFSNASMYKKLSYCWETVRRDSMPKITEMDVKITT